MHIPCERFVRYDELSELLRALTVEYPDVFAVESIGRTVEQRDILLCTITNRAAGPHLEKPALWIDGNIHAAELAGSTAALLSSAASWPATGRTSA